MSKHNYTKYSSDKQDTVIEEVETSVSGMPVLEMPIVEPETPAVEVTEQVAEVEEPPVVLAETVDGIVVNCAKLNVRAQPNVTAAIVCVLTADSEIEINISKSTDEWFNVYTAAGVEGYCMRKFVNAKL